MMSFFAGLAWMAGCPVLPGRLALRQSADGCDSRDRNLYFPVFASTVRLSHQNRRSLSSWVRLS